ncbi:MAG: DUF2807 domain-containing protein [Ferruginibacter sp.]|nr:DUF2807 domain-containing protein [Ferruginibacter sp.]
MTTQLTTGKFSTTLKWLLTFFLASNCCIVSAVDEKDSRRMITKEIGIPDLCIKAEIGGDVKIILVNSADNKLIFIGTEKNVNRTTIKVNKKTFTVNVPDKDNGPKTKVYIPVNLLEFIKINGDAEIYSEERINNTNLLILLNGACFVNIKSQGTVTVKADEGYELDNE